MVKSVAAASIETLTAIAIHCFRSLDNVMPFRKIFLPGVGGIDYVLVRHAPMRPEIDDFTLVYNEAGKNQPVKRARLQAVCELWGVKGYVLVRERPYEDLMSHEGEPIVGYSPDHPISLVICDMVTQDDGRTLPRYQFVSMARDADAVLQRGDICLPVRDEFIRTMNAQLRRILLSQVRKRLQTMAP